MIRENILNVREGVISACSKVNRDPESVTVVVVAKNRDLQQVSQAIQAGIDNIAENKIQEALPKINHLTTLSLRLSTVKWHMVGHLQTNKVKEAVRYFDLIQSLDSMRLAAEINQAAAKINKIQEVLLEVKTSPEATKFGFAVKDTAASFTELLKFRHLSIKGLMTVAPLVDDPQKTRPYFKALKDTFDAINKLPAVFTYAAGRDFKLSILSMGMTDDFKIAIEEGATMIRIGRAIFEG